MSEKKSIDEIAKKYKEEMMRLYSKAASGASVPEKKAEPEKKKTEEPLQVKQPEENAPEKPEEVSDVRPETAKPKFPPPDEILKAESESIPEAALPAKSAEKAYKEKPAEESAERINARGNYSFDPAEENPPEKTLEPLYSGEKNERTEKLTGQGFLKAEVTTGGGAVPIKDATVIITKKNGDGASLVKMLSTNENGETETVSLPAPDIAYSETPEPDERPFAEYTLSASADGFYLVPEMTVPVFPTVISIQPVAMIPLAEYDSAGSASPADGNNS